MARTLERGSEPVQPGRVYLAMLAVALVFALFAGRLFQLQLIEGEELLRRSEQNSVRTVRLSAPRGEIVDREGRVLATTRPAFGLEVVPDDVHHPRRTFAALGQLLGQDPAVLATSAGKPSRAGRFKAVRLADDLSPDQLARIEVHRYALPGVSTEVRAAAPLRRGRARRPPPRLARRDPAGPARAGGVRGLPAGRRDRAERPRGALRAPPARRGRRPERRRGRGRPRDGRARRGEAAPGPAGGARPRPRPPARRRAGVERDRPAERSAADGRRGRARRPDRRRARDGVAARLRPELLCGPDRQRDLEGAQHRRVGPAPEPRDPEPVPAGLDLQGVRGGRRAPRRRDQRAHDGVLPGVVLVRRARVSLLAARRPRHGGPARGAAELVRRLLLHGRREARHRAAVVRHQDPRARAPDGHRLRPRGPGRDAEPASGRSSASASAGTPARRSRSRSGRATTS